VSDDGFSLPVPAFKADEALVQIKRALRAMNTPEWDRMTVRSSVDQRKWIDEVKKRLARWEYDE
jgi:hypothetical protein